MITVITYVIHILLLIFRFIIFLIYSKYVGKENTESTGWFLSTNELILPIMMEKGWQLGLLGRAGCGTGIFFSFWQPAYAESEYKGSGFIFPGLLNFFTYVSCAPCIKIPDILFKPPQWNSLVILIQHWEMKLIQKTGTKSEFIVLINLLMKF